ncbi:MAG: YlxM family DNA-binding protein [Acetatifactor sp.]|nr:YlxM family DNA-binding protein [Acetatifactor sp.]MDE7351631.1 YlxM family DNA-binding protein [Acetatifactor sp.]
MDRIFEQTLLYDFYGELLTPHQRGIYEEAVFNDMSLGEIAEEYGISRQGVHDLIRRCDRILQDYESKLHLAERFVSAKEKITQIAELTKENPVPGTKGGQPDSGERMERIRFLCQELLKEL